MASCNTNKLPQVGSVGSADGESRSPSGGCPSYSGGGTNRHEGFGPHNDDQGKCLDTDCTTKGILKGHAQRAEFLERKSSDGDLLTRSKSLEYIDVDVVESDSEVSVRSLRSSPVPMESSTSRHRKRRMERQDNEDQAVSSPKAPSRRGRGRPPTTGQYVGFARAKAELKQTQEEEERLEAERQMAEEHEQNMARSRDFFKKKGPQEKDVDVRNVDMAGIERLVSDSLDSIKKVARSSRNLKGTFVRTLNESVGIVQDSFQELRNRTMPEEVALLVEANNKLTAELQEIRREMAEMRAAQARPPPPPAPAPTPVPALEEVLRAVMVQVGTMINARFEGLEERLLPEKRVRPPLAADRRREAALAIASTSAVVPLPSTPPSRATELERDTASRVGKSTPSSARPANPKRTPAARPTAPVLDPWSRVVGRGSGKGGRVEGPKRLRSSAPERMPVPKSAPQTTKGKAAKLRPPRTAAVIITLQQGATEKGITYAKVLGEAKSRIDLAALGVQPLKMRAAATGARVLEIPGEDKEQKADSLAEKLREVFRGTEEIQVSRPTTTVDLRVSGLDDSVGSNELNEAIARAGGCPAAAIKTGEIRKGPAGMGTAFVRCPVTAAKKIVANGGRLMVGWIAAQVRLLDARPRRCYRCLELGHVRAQCKSEVDRSGECYRCGQTGHKASDCSAAPHCTLCAAAGKPAEHLSGGKACAKPPSKIEVRKKKAATKSRSQPTRSTVEQETRMEES